MSGPATFVMSLDTELAWGTFYWGGTKYYASHFSRYREEIDKLILAMDRFGISATWAVVGHLFLSSCDGVHADVLRPRYSWMGYRDWHLMDPGSDVERAPWWYAPDIVRRIQAMRTPQEIGTHTFSHALLDDPDCSAAVARSQVMAAIEAASPFGVKTRTLVFPRDGVAYLAEYAPLGIRCFRGKERAWYARIPGLLGRVAHVIDHGLGLPPPICRWNELQWREGLLEIPSSHFILSYDRFHRFVPARSRWRKIRMGLERAISKGGIYHVVFHPFHLGSSPDILELLERLFEEVARLRDLGDLTVSTMEGVRAMAAESLG